MKTVIAKQVQATYSFKDLPSMIEQAFLVMDHESGSFGIKKKSIFNGQGDVVEQKYIMLTYSTNPGYLESMNEYYDVYITYLPEFSDPMEVSLEVYKVYLYDGSYIPIGNKMFSFSRSDFPRIPYELVSTTYNMIDNQPFEVEE